MQKPNIAVALSVQRKNRIKKKMAPDAPLAPSQQEYMDKDEQDQALKEGKPLSDMYNPKPKMAMGGEVKASDLMSDDERAGSIADAIMRKRKMADGGMVDLEANSEESGNIGDGLNMEALGKEQYDDDQPMDSNEHGDDIESKPLDMIGKIRAKMRAKRT